MRRYINPPLRHIKYFFNSPIICRLFIRHGIDFVIRAAMNPLIERAVAALSGSDWQPLRYQDGSLSQHQWVARCSQAMYRSDQVFDLVVQRTLKPLPAQKKMVIQLLSRQRILAPFVDDTAHYDYYVIESIYYKADYAIK